MMPNNLPFMVSYAQTGEDILLRRALRHVQTGFYVDIGAQDPTLDSVTRHFYNHGWSGINIEPHPTYFAALKRERTRDINIQTAIAASGTLATFHFVDDSGLSSLSPRSAEVAAKHHLKSHTGEVRLMKLADVLEANAPRDIHFLKVDVEGFELDVLRSGDWNRHRPWIVVVEGTLPAEPTPCWELFEPFMLDARYRPVAFDGLNRWYVREESADLVDSFACPVNVFDNYQRWKEFEWDQWQASRRAAHPSTSFAAAFGR